MIIFLTGMPGSGKSTTGSLLAGQLGFRFSDLDAEIEKTRGKSIRKIFSEDGEDAFREAEREALEQFISTTDNLVLACGGGTPCFFENLGTMKKAGWVVYLQADIETLMSRLQGEQEGRPLISEDTRVKLMQLLEQRETTYLQAHTTVETEGKTPLEIASILVSEIKAQGHQD